MFQIYKPDVSGGVKVETTENRDGGQKREVVAVAAGGARERLLLRLRTPET